MCFESAQFEGLRERTKAIHTLSTSTKAVTSTTNRTPPSGLSCRAPEPAHESFIHESLKMEQDA